MITDIDVSEHILAETNPAVINILLKDQTTEQNIVWASDDYAHLGEEYSPENQIEVSLITGKNSKLIRPRISKNLYLRNGRRWKRAEVFTPAWVCNLQNNLVDEAWFGWENVFNIGKPNGWETLSRPIDFSNTNRGDWKAYVDERRLEVACGEAPYLVSRYDSVTGDFIEVPDRVGILDRKLRVVFENVSHEDDLFPWILRAYQSVYGFEIQGDSLLLARENLLYTFRDYIRTHLGRASTDQELRKVAHVISWNLWQMDGSTFRVNSNAHSNSSSDSNNVFQEALFESDYDRALGPYSLVKDWRAKKTMEFRALVESL